MNGFVSFLSGILGDDENAEAEERPCPDFYETCCSLASPTVVEFKPPTEKPIPPKPLVGISNKCGVRNKNGAIFQVTDRDNEAQFGKYGRSLERIHRSISKQINERKR